MAEGLGSDGPLQLGSCQTFVDAHISTGLADVGRVASTLYMLEVSMLCTSSALLGEVRNSTIHQNHQLTYGDRVAC